MMRAAVIEHPRTVGVAEVDPPSPGPGDVLVRLDGSGICGSNLPVWEGRPWFTYPLPPGAPGHEGWGRIERLGQHVAGLEVGTPVALLSAHAFAEFDIASADQVVPVPSVLAGRPFPGEALGCGVNVMARTPVGAGVRVAIVGVGFLGAVLVILARRAGAEVTAISRRDTALETALHLGASHAIRLRDLDTTAGAARAANGGQDFDVVIEAIGLQASLDLASRLTRTRGCLVVAGYHQDGPRLVDLQSWNWRGLDVVNAHERDPAIYVRGIRTAAQLAADGTLPIDALVTHVFPLHGLGAAFRSAVERPRGFVKAVVTTHA